MAEGNAMQREEKRGRGRAPGARTKRSRQHTPEIEQGISPAEVLLGSMRLYWAEAHDEQLEDNYRAWALDKAAEIAIQAAPYFHAELVATDVEHSGGDDGIRSELSEEQQGSDSTDPQPESGDKLH